MVRADGSCMRRKAASETCGICTFRAGPANPAIAGRRGPGPVIACVSEAVCKPSSVPHCLTAQRGWPSISGRRSPDGSCGRPEGWAAHLSPADGCPPTGCALLFGLAPGGVCPFHSADRLAPPTASSLWHWSSPCGGRALPATLRCGARTFLTTPRSPSPARDHPTVPLTSAV